jgi:murein DD-endopeptidase MepM/ murein hydrolase activator NlpD
MEKIKWIWPIPSVNCKIPDSEKPGSFGFVRKHDVHTGIDIYCEPGAEVVAVEDGVVKHVEEFTGSNAGSPWWNNTDAVWIEGNSGVVVYGEIEVDVKVGQKISAGDIVGRVKTVLLKNKGLPMTMLHIELYHSSMNETVWWNKGDKKPGTLLDPTTYLDKLN